MSTQLLTDQTFSAQNVALATQGKQEAGRMTLAGVTVKSLLFIAITIVFGAIGWNRALSIIETTSSLWFLLGYLVLIAVSIWAMANPRFASIVGVIYGVCMGLWMGAISRVYEAAWDGIVAQALLATMRLCCLRHSLQPGGCARHLEVRAGDGDRDDRHPDHVPGWMGVVAVRCQRGVLE